MPYLDIIRVFGIPFDGDDVEAHGPFAATFEKAIALGDALDLQLFASINPCQRVSRMRTTTGLNLNEHPFARRRFHHEVEFAAPEPVVPVAQRIALLQEVF